MQRNAAGRAAIGITAVVVLTAGCQFPGFRSARSEPSAPPEGPLNSRQVAQVQLSLARSLELRGEIEPAIKAYQRVVEKDPRQATGFWRMAILQDRQGMFEESAALYQKALKLDAKNPDLLCDYGYSLYLQRRWGEAEERLRQAIGLDARHSRAHNHLGLVLAEAEQGDEALAEFRKAGCAAAEAHSNLAFVMTLNRRWTQARRQYALALNSNPQSAAAKTGLANLEAVVASAAASDGVLELTHHEGAAAGSPR